MNVLKIYVMDFGTIISNGVNTKWFSINDINSLRDYTMSQCKEANKIKVSVVDTDALKIEGSIKTTITRNLVMIKGIIPVKVRVKKVGISEIEEFIDVLPEKLKKQLIMTEVA